MTREEAKELLPILQAFTEGKTIEYREYDGEWKEAHTPIWSSRLFYRIKPESKYRPFKTQEECWEEMLKHQPFGWVKYKETGTYIMISTIYSTTTDHLLHVTNPQEVSIDCCEYSFSGTFDNFCFADDTPFGIKED